MGFLTKRFKSAKPLFFENFDDGNFDLKIKSTFQVVVNYGRNYK